MLAQQVDQSQPNPITAAGAEPSVPDEQLIVTPPHRSARRWLVVGAILVGLILVLAGGYLLYFMRDTSVSPVSQPALSPSPSPVPATILDVLTQQQLDEARGAVTIIFAGAYEYKQKYGSYPIDSERLVREQFLKEEMLADKDGLKFRYLPVDDGTDCQIVVTPPQGAQLINYCRNMLKLDDREGVFQQTPQEHQAQVETQKMLPYMSAASDVEMIFSAVSRYKAFQQKFPTSLQDLVAADELKSTFITKERDGYTLSFSAATDADCQIIVEFDNGQTMVSRCTDPNYLRQFTDQYTTKK